MTAAPDNDWIRIRRLLWDDDEHILVVENVHTSKPMRRASSISPQPSSPYCTFNSFQDGTSRCQDNVARHHSFVIEHDKHPIDEQRRFWAESDMPYTLRVFSAGKSIHVWIRLDEDLSHEAWHEIALQLFRIYPDADAHVLKDSSRLCRTPNATRETGKQQAVESIGRRVSLSDLVKWIRKQSVPETTETTETTEAILSSLSGVSGTSCSTEDVIRKTLPSKPGERHTRIFDLARGLKFNAGLAEHPLRDLRPLVKQWHGLAIKVIRTKAFDETWEDFVHAWRRARLPLGDVIHLAWQKATSRPLPEEALEYETDMVRHLVALCKVMGALSGSGDFFLSSHYAGRLLNVSHRKVLRKLQMIEADELIETRKKGNAHRATRYRWKGKQSP